MKKLLVAASFACSAALLAAAPSVAQTTRETKVSHDTSTKDGVATAKTTVTHTTKHETNRPKKILGVKVGHKTVVHKTVKKTSVSSNGDTTTTVKTN